MKIALVRRGYSSTGGAEAYLRRFAGALTQAGHQPTLFTTNDWPQEEAAPFAVERLGTGLGPKAFAEALAARQEMLPVNYTFSLERVPRCDCFRAGDGVHAAWLKRRARFEPIWQSLFRKFQPKHRELLALERQLFSEGGAGRVIANSGLVRDEIVANFGYPAERLHVVYNGVPPALDEEESARARTELRQKMGLSPEQYVVLFAGSGWTRKGLRYAVRAIEGVQGVEPLLLVAGRGRRRGMPHSPRVRFLGPVSGGLARVYALADAFVLPTIYDPFSNACLEAMAAGLPVITTRANGFGEILAPGEGEVLAEPDNVPALTAALSAWADPARRAAVRTPLRAKGALYSMERNLRESLAVVCQSLPPVSP